MTLQDALTQFGEAIETGVQCAAAFNLFLAPVLVDASVAPSVIAAIETAVAAYCVTFGTVLGKTGTAELQAAAAQIVNQATSYLQFLVGPPLAVGLLTYSAPPVPAGELLLPLVGDPATPRAFNDRGGPSHLLNTGWNTRVHPMRALEYQ